MRLDTDGLIIIEKTVSDTDKLVTILTRKNGIIRAFAKNVKNIKSKNFAAIQLLAYSNFNIYKGHDKYIINEATLNNCFWSLRTDIKKVALAQYFCEIILNLVGENCESENILRLTLNAFHYITKNSLDNNVIKSIFEMKILSMSGYMPDLTCCKICKQYNASKMYFDISKGRIICNNCIGNVQRELELTKGVLAALRHIIYSDFNKMFLFDLNLQSKKELSFITEKYLIRCIDRKICTLDFYKRIMID